MSGKFTTLPETFIYICCLVYVYKIVEFLLGLQINAEITLLQLKHVYSGTFACL